MGRPIEQACIGDRFGRIVVVAMAEPEKDGAKAVLGRCDCGTLKGFRTSNLRRGISKSCGCLNRQHLLILHTKHGMARSAGPHPLFWVWNSMQQRCHNPRNKSFKHYGGRGIEVCARWRASFADFLADVGLRPARGMSLDRINNDGNYEPGNVRWATAVQQANNRRISRANHR